MKNLDVTSTTENNNNKNDNINVILICPFKRKWRFYKKKSINKSKNWLWIFLKFKFCSGKDCEEDEKTSYRKEENTCRPICDKWLAAELNKNPQNSTEKKKTLSGQETWTFDQRRYTDGKKPHDIQCH